MEAKVDTRICTIFCRRGERFAVVDVPDVYKTPRFSLPSGIKLAIVILLASQHYPKEET